PWMAGIASGGRLLRADVVARDAVLLRFLLDRHAGARPDRDAPLTAEFDHRSGAGTTVGSGHPKESPQFGRISKPQRIRDEYLFPAARHRNWPWCRHKNCVRRSTLFSVGCY